MCLADDYEGWRLCKQPVSLTILLILSLFVIHALFYGYYLYLELKLFYSGGANHGVQVKVEVLVRE